MEYREFSDKEFKTIASSSNKLKQRCSALEKAIAQELNRCFQIELTKIVRELKNNGHDLKPYNLNFPEGLDWQIFGGELHYRDDSGDEDNYQCKLRLAADFTVTVGYLFK